MRTVLTKALLATLVFSALAVPGNVMAGGPPMLGAMPQVVLEAVDKNGAPAEGIMVTVVSVTEGKTVLQQKTDKSGRVHFASTLPASVIKTAPGAVKDAVYEVYYVSPEGELQYTTMSVPHMKDLARAKAADRQELERGRVKYVQAHMNGKPASPELTDSTVTTFTTEPDPLSSSDPEYMPINDPNFVIISDPVTTVNDGSSETSADGTVAPNDPEPTTTVTDSGSTVTPSSIGCTYLSYEQKYCVREEKWYTKATRIGEAHVGNGESVDFNLTSSAKVSFEIGYKVGSGSWGANGSVSLSSDTATGVDYTFTGTCTTVSGYYRCNLGRRIYANYEYRYQKRDWYWNGVYSTTTYEVLPTRLVGSTTYYTWFYSSRDGKSVSSVKGNSYGAYFQIANGVSTSRRYTAEEKFTLTATIPTPVGDWSPALTTQYVNSHSIKWYTSSSRVFYHYDWDRSGQNWYSTY